MTLTARPLPAPRAAPREPRELPELPGRARDHARLASNATLLARDDATETLAVFTLERDELLEPFAAGQYVSVGIVEGGRQLQRPYSVVSLTHGGRRIELLVKQIAGGELSQRLWCLEPGTRLRVGPARGLFKWAPASSSKHVFVAGGTGIAPFMAMLHEATVESQAHEITLVHGVSYAEELVFRDRLEAMASAGLDLIYRPTISRPHDPQNGAWEGAVGRAEDQLRLSVEDQSFERDRTTFYLCGGGGMVEECTRVLVAAGLPTERIRSERFHLAAA